MVARVHPVAPRFNLKPFKFAPTRAGLSRNIYDEILLRSVTLTATQRGSHPQNGYVRGWGGGMCDAYEPSSPSIPPRPWVFWPSTL